MTKLDDIQLAQANLNISTAAELAAIKTELAWHWRALAMIGAGICYLIGSPFFHGVSTMIGGLFSP